MIAKTVAYVAIQIQEKEAQKYKGYTPSQLQSSNDKLSCKIPPKKSERYISSNSYYCSPAYRGETAVSYLGPSLELEAKLGFIKVGAGFGISVDEIEYTYEGISCYKTDYTSLSALFAGSKRYYKTPVNCVTGEIIGETIYGEDNFILWFKWDKKGNVKTEIDFGFSVPGGGIETDIPLD